MEEVPRPEKPFLTLDEQPALAGEHEEEFLLLIIRGGRDRSAGPAPRTRSLMPSCGKGNSRLSNRQSEPGGLFSVFSAVDHWASPAFTTNHPSPTGARPRAGVLEWRLWHATTLLALGLRPTLSPSSSSGSRMNLACAENDRVRE